MQESCEITDRLIRLLQDNRLAGTAGNLPLAATWASLAPLNDWKHIHLKHVSFKGEKLE